MLFDAGLLVTGFVILILGAHGLVNGASSVAKRLRVAELIIGLTIVAFGTSAPELVVNIVASKERLSDVVLGNVIGSNIFNLLLILGISGTIFPITVQNQTVWKEIPISLFTVLVLMLLANFGVFHEPGVLHTLSGIILLSLFGGFMGYVYSSLLSGNSLVSDGINVYSVPVSILLIILGLTGLVLGGNLVVQKSVAIARYFSMSEKLIGLTIVSIGTSLPELATSVVAAFKKKSDLVIGNVIGSNIFNILLILGLCAFINPINYNPAFNADLIILSFASFFLFFAMFTGVKKKLDRWEAAILLMGFIGYMVFIILRN